MVEATIEFWTQQADLWTQIMRKTLGEEHGGPVIEPENRITSYNVCYTKLLRY